MLLVRNLLVLVGMFCFLGFALGMGNNDISLMLDAGGLGMLSLVAATLITYAKAG